MANSKTKAATVPSKVDLARADFLAARREYNDCRKPGQKHAPNARSVAAAKLTAAQMVLEAELAQADADAARARADAALKDVEKALALALAPALKPAAPAKASSAAK